MNRGIIGAGILSALLFYGTFITEASAQQTQSPSLQERITILEEQLLRLQHETIQANKEAEEIHRLTQDTDQIPLLENKPSESLEERVLVLEDQAVETEDAISNLSSTLSERVDLNLYGTAEFRAFQHSEASFGAKTAEVLMAGRLTNRLHGFLGLHFATGGHGHGGEDGASAEIERAWFEYIVDEAFRARAGIILVPFGRYNREHFDPVRDLSDQPLAMSRIVPVTWAEAGVGLNGSAYLGESFQNTWLDELALDYAVYLVNGLTDDISDTGLEDARGGFGTDNNNGKAVVGRIQTTLMTGVELGVSGYTGSYDSAGHRANGINGDWKVTMWPLEFLGEYAWWDLDKGGFQHESDTQKVPTSLRGGYAQMNYHFWFEALNNTFLGRSFENPTFTGVIRYGHARIRDDNDVGTGTNKESRLTLGLNYRPIESFVVKTEYQFNSNKNEPLESGDANGVVISVSAAF